MKLSLDPAELKKALSYVLPVINLKASPLLLNVLIDVTEKGVKLRATDSIVSAGVQVPTKKIEQLGCFGVEAKRLHTVVSNLPKRTTTISYADNKVSVTAKGSKTKLACIPGMQFPQAEYPPNMGVQVSTDVLVPLLRWAKQALINDQTRAVISGLRLNIKKQSIEASCCDGLRLTRAGIRIENEAELLVFLPPKATSMLLKLCEWTRESTINICVGGRTVFFWNDLGVGYSCRLATEKGIDADQIFPKGEPHTSIAVSRGLFHAACVRSQAIDDRSVVLRYADKALEVGVSSSVGESSQTLAANLTGKPGEVIVDCKHLAEALGSMAGDHVYLYLWDFKDGVVLRSADEEIWALFMRKLRGGEA